MQRVIKVTFEDGNTITTWINGTEDEIRRYYFAQPFQFGDTEECPRDKMLWAVAVEFLEKATGCTHNTMQSRKDLRRPLWTTYAWECAHCGYLYGAPSLTPAKPLRYEPC